MDWKLVPTRLTQNMANAAKCVDARLSVWKYDDAYQAMLANAPEPPETSAQTVAQLQARVAELEAALTAERDAYAATCRTADAELGKTRDALSGMVEFFQPHAWGSGDNRADALREARKALGIE